MADITKAEIRKIKDKAMQLLQDELGDEYGVTIGRASYGYVGLVTLEITKADDSGEIETKLEKDFRFNATYYGLEPDDFGARFISRGKPFEIVGLKPRNHKYPIIGRDVVTNKNYKFSSEVVVAAKNLGRPNWMGAEFYHKE